MEFDVPASPIERSWLGSSSLELVGKSEVLGKLGEFSLELRECRSISRAKGEELRFTVIDRQANQYDVRDLQVFECRSPRDYRFIVDLNGAVEFAKGSTTVHLAVREIRTLTVERVVSTTRGNAATVKHNVVLRDGASASGKMKVVEYICGEDPTSLIWYLPLSDPDTVIVQTITFD